MPRTAAQKKAIRDMVARDTFGNRVCQWCGHPAPESPKQGYLCPQCLRLQGAEAFPDDVPDE